MEEGKWKDGEQQCSRTSEKAGNHCKYFVKRKKRYCKMTVKEGNDFCGEHMEISDTDNKIGENLEKNLQRIKCPYDDKHSVYVNKLQKHLKICNARKKPQPPYIIPFINEGRNETCNVSERKRMVDLSQSELEDLIARISNVYDGIPPQSMEVLKHSLLSEEMMNPNIGPKKIKHLAQNASLLRHAELAGFCENGTAFIEFGAGRGQMTYYVAQRMQDSSNCLYLLVDNASQKHKFDNKMKDSPSYEIVRIRANIADLSLCHCSELTSFSRVVTVSKHLCGVATDYALRCMAEQELPWVSFLGIMIAFCCHHRCNWGSYTGKLFLTNHGFTQEHFDVMCGIASWATCGFKRNGSESKDQESDDEDMVPLNERCDLNLTDEDKAAIGRKVKCILNYGRLAYLEQHGFLCKLVKYIGEDISPENVCIIATKLIQQPTFVDQGKYQSEQNEKK